MNVYENNINEIELCTCVDPDSVTSPSVQLKGGIYSFFPVPVLPIKYILPNLHAQKKHKKKKPSKS